MSDYERTTTTSAGNTKTVPRSELSAKSNRSTSSGRGSVEEDEDADVEIRMINEGNWNMQTSVQSTTGKNLFYQNRILVSFLLDQTVTKN